MCQFIADLAPKRWPLRFKTFACRYSETKARSRSRWPWFSTSKYRRSQLLVSGLRAVCIIRWIWSFSFILVQYVAFMYCFLQLCRNQCNYCQSKCNDRSCKGGAREPRVNYAASVISIQVLVVKRFACPSIWVNGKVELTYCLTSCWRHTYMCTVDLTLFQEALLEILNPKDRQSVFEQRTEASSAEQYFQVNIPNYYRLSYWRFCLFFIRVLHFKYCAILEYVCLCCLS